MAEAPPKPRIFVSTSLSAEDCETLNKLAQTLLETPHDHQSHVNFITLLHKGFVNHIESGGDPHAYDLLSDLRQSFPSMDKIYPVGEDLWTYWLDDEKTLANDVESKISVIELFSKATQDEPYSAALWRMYGDYMYTGFACVFDLDAPEKWSDDDKLIGKELFTWEQMMTVWDRAVAATQYRMNDSNIVWDRYIQIVLEDHQRYPTSEKVRHIEALFAERLMRPHATWDQTFQQLSTFVTTYDQNAYDSIMTGTTANASKVKQQYTVREVFEFKLLKAVQAGDRTAEWYAFTEYLNWEKYTQGIFSFHLINALFERATLRFPTVDSLWEDHAEFLIKNPDSSVSLLQFLERANRHCPWSGNLWSHRILALEADKRSFAEIESVKHSATETGVLESGGMEDLIKVYIAWCGFLRRKAFGQGAAEEDEDIAEVSIRSALEHVREIGIKKYGDSFEGDPQYRLERIYIKFFTQCGNLDEARNIWNSLIKRQQDSYDFWYRYYIWEMVVWSNHAIPDKSSGIEPQTPQRVTAILRQGLKRYRTLDQPELLVQMFLNHCEQHESVQELQNAMIEARQKATQIQKRREREAAAAAEQYQQAAEASTETVMTDVPEETTRKRERSPEPADPISNKKTKSEAAPAVSVSVEEQGQPEPKRDREHTTLIVKKLPLDATQTQIRQHFQSCGKVQSINMKKFPKTITAVIEFERFDEAEYAAFQAKPFHGTPIEVSNGTNSTLFVANYKPSASEEYILNIFKDFGEIIDIRLPSLKFDTHRRFCYVQFSSSDEATAATSLHDTEIDGYKLTALISNPNIKKVRAGRVFQGREIYVGQLDWSSTEDDVKALFSKFGDIERLKYPKSQKGTGKGYCFLAFVTEEAANAAVAEMNGKSYHNRNLHVEIATDRAGSGVKPQSVLQFNSASRSPSANPEFANKEDAEPGECAVHLEGIPETVRDSRLQEIAQKYGPLRRLVLKHDRHAAVAVYESANDAANAALALEGYEITPGHTISVELDKNTMVPNKRSKLVPSFNRPVRSGGATVKSKRGGLGFHRTGFGTGASKNTGNSSTSEANGGTAPKSNAAFREMFLRGKDNADKPTETKEE